jgi:predicted alpha/beta-fold hydrolase
MGLSQRFKLLIAVTALGLVAACASGGGSVVENDEHPFPESMFATLSSLAYPARSPEFAKSLTVYRVAVKGFQKPLPVWYWKRPGAKMSFVLLSGYGGSPESNIVQALAEHLWEIGFSVLSLPSSTHEEFAQAASTKRLPGHIPRDLLELGAALDELRARLSQREPELLSTRWALAGLSYGALQTVQEALAASPHSRFQFEAFVAFNPPVRLSYSMSRLDESFERGAPLHLRANGELDTELADKIRAAEGRLLYWSEALAAFEQEELEFLLAWDFRKSLLKAIAWPQPDPRSLSFTNYIRRELIPSLSPLTDIAGWSRLQDLYTPGGAGTPQFYPRSLLVFHSLNDPLCTEGDLLWLKGRMGTQMQLYRQGGHLGYVWSDRFRADLRASLQPLLDSGQKE